jgi:hypothetical protein
VRGHEHSGAEGVDLDEELDDLPARHRVEVPGWLVGDEQRRVVHQRPGDRRPLLLSAGELAREMPAVLVQPNEVEELRHASPDLAPRRTGDLQGEGHVLPDGLVRKEPEVLEDGADAAPELRHLATPEPRDVTPGDGHPPGGWQDVADEEAQERRLPRARGPDEEYEVAAGNLDVDVAQGNLAVRVGHPGVEHADDRLPRDGSRARRWSQQGARHQPRRAS